MRGHATRSAPTRPSTACPAGPTELRRCRRTPSQRPTHRPSTCKRRGRTQVSLTMPVRDLARPGLATRSARRIRHRRGRPRPADRRRRRARRPVDHDLAVRGDGRRTRDGRRHRAADRHAGARRSASRGCPRAGGRRNVRLSRLLHPRTTMRPRPSPAFPVGATCSCNLQPLCRGHHRLKTTGHLSVRLVQPGEDENVPRARWNGRRGPGRIYRSMPVTTRASRARARIGGNSRTPGGAPAGLGRAEVRGLNANIYAAYARRLARQLDEAWDRVERPGRHRRDHRASAGDASTTTRLRSEPARPLEALGPVWTLGRRPGRAAERRRRRRPRRPAQRVRAPSVSETAATASGVTRQQPPIEPCPGVEPCRDGLRLGSARGRSSAVATASHLSPLFGYTTTGLPVISAASRTAGRTPSGSVQFTPTARRRRHPGPWRTPPRQVRRVG